MNNVKILSNVSFLVETVHFNDVIQIEDNFNVNSFLNRLSREKSKHRVKDLNSVFIKHMFLRTENSTDSEISPDYMERMHEIGKILLDFSDKIREAKTIKNGMCYNLTNFSLRMKNLIGLVNAEKFDFEDLSAWRMGSKMETLFRERWKILSEEFSILKISLNDRIRQNDKVSGKIYSVGEIKEQIEKKQNQMIKMQEDSINAIRDIELESYYKQRLKIQLIDQIRDESRDIKIVLENLFHAYKHEIQKERGKFSRTALEKKIVKLIDDENAIENISDKDVFQKFENFWTTIIQSSEILEFRRNIEITENEQMVKLRHDVKKAFETCFEYNEVDIAAKNEFKELKSIENWQFSEAQFKEIKITDEKYFEKNILKKFAEKFAGKLLLSKNSQLMPQLLNQFHRLIDENRYTKNNVAGFVDNKVILELCSEFKKVLWLKLKEFDLKNSATPLFRVHVVGFACFKLLLPRLKQNLEYYQGKMDPVKKLNSQKDYFQNLYRCKIQGAKQSIIWEQKLTKAMLEIIVEIFLNPVGSQATNELIYKFIQNSGTDQNRNDFFRSRNKI